MSLLKRIAYQHNARQARNGFRSREYRRQRFKLIPSPLLRLEDRQLLSTFTVTSTADDGSTGTLRWAINQVNSDTGPFPDMIDFNFVGTGPFSIQPTSPLPTIANPVIVNGYSEPNSSPNTLAQGDNAVILIDLNGSSASSNDGLAIAGGNSVVEGLAISNYSNAIHLENSGGDAVTGSFIGTDPTGETAQSATVGVFVDNVASNTIGGTTAGARDVISDGSNEGIELSGSSATGNLIAGSYIGTDATGTAGLGNNTGVLVTNNSGTNKIGGGQAGAGNLISGNTNGGILIEGGSNDNLIEGNNIGTNAAGTAAIPNGYPGYIIVPGVGLYGSSNTVGGTTPGTGNLISGNGADGIDIVYTSAQYNLVEGNLIGTDVTGSQNLGNQAGGISIFYGASNNTVGGLAPGSGNVIANNSRLGVNVGVDSNDNCPGNAILSNSIYNNAPLGIDLGFNGVTLNTPGGHSNGPNNLQNFPVLTQVLSFTGVSTAVTGTLNSGADSTFTLQFFANTTADPSGYGQGQTLIGTTTVTTDENGNASFEVVFPISIAAGDAVSATATDALGDTSEFANDVVAVAAAPPVAAFNDIYGVSENTTLTVPAPGVQANDISADGGSFTSVVVSPPTNGILNFNSDGSFTYTPNDNFDGTDLFTYEDVENGQSSNVAIVTIEVGQLTVDVVNTLDDGSPGSLPWAINLVNNDTNVLPAEIDFDIPGTGPFVIQATTPLPAIVHPVIINGYSQPGASPNTLAQGDNAAILINLNAGLGDGLDIDGGDSVVEGLAIGGASTTGMQLESAGGDVIAGNFLGTDTTGENGEGNSYGMIINNVGGNTIGGVTPDARNIISDNGEGIQIAGSGATANLIAGNYIGTDATGTNRLSNGMGLEFENGSWGNTVGGAQPGAGNLVSGNGGDAIKIDVGCFNNVVQGNLVGTDVTGESPLINYGNGVDINGNNNTIGGTTPGSGNVLSGNSADGIVMVFMAGSYNLVEGNLIGTDLTGTQPIPNQQNGVQLFFNSQFNTIGGTVAGAANTIAFNQGTGVTIGLGTGDYCPGNAIMSNSIFGNGRLGIDLGGDGVTLNSPGSGHFGPNNLQSFPVLNEAIAFTGVSTVFVGSLNSAPDATFTLQFFSNPSADPSGYGQGQTLIGTTSVTTDSSGNASFQASFPALVSVGDAVSATATDSSGDTSEFAQDDVVVAGTPPVAALDDTYYLDENTTVTEAAPGVQANDVSADGGSITSVLVSPPSNGSLSFNSDGSFSYTPYKNFTGLDSFTYEDVENGQNSNVATVTLLVNPLTLDVTNTLDDGSPGSLRWAINLANSDPSSLPVTIDFDIPGAGPFVLQPTTPLPPILHSVLIDGYTEPGASPNTLGQGDNAVILIDLNGSGVSNSDGLDIEAGNSVVEGLAIGWFTSAIHLETAGGDIVIGNFLGTDTTGENGENNSLGVLIDNIPGNTIGGMAPAARNIVSGNNEGIQINGSGATGNLIVGNYIGTDATGTNRLPNGLGLEFQNNSWGNTVGGAQWGAGNLVSGNNGDGIKIDGACYDNVVQGNIVGTDVTGENALVNYGNGVDINGNNNTIGGTTPGAGNVLSGNSGDGIVLVFNSASYNLMEGNLIGTDISGTEPVPNDQIGIQFFFSASYNTVGGTVAGAGNVIAFNQAQGVSVGLSASDGCVGDAILSNSIFGNSRIGIDLGGDGVTLNSPGSPHSGANNLQSFPVLNEAVAFTGFSTVIAGSLNSAADSAFALQFFSSSSADPSGYGQGQTLLGSTAVTTDSNGNASFEVSFPVVVSSGYAISATATDSSGDTSEFAQDVFVIAAAPPIAALNDNYNTDINTTLSVSAPGVQANDIAADGGSFTSILVSSPKHGALTFNSNGSFTYVPKKSYTGADSFTYKDEENGQYSNVATVAISVNPKTLYVTNTNPTGPGSLFQALTVADASNSAGADSVLFEIPGTGPFDISLTQSLPAITHATIVNGYSQAGAHKNSSIAGDSAVIEVQIDGSNLPNGSSGLVLAGSGSTIEGLSLTRFTNAILIDGPGSDSIAGDFLGANPSGTGYGWGNQVGVFITGSSGNSIGGSVANRNLISANIQAGVQLENGASANVIASNYIGTDITGVDRMSNGTGIALYDSPDNTIGGSTAPASNVISGNNNDGILASSLDNGPGSTDTVIEGNDIGIDATGSIAVGNGNNGVHIVDAAGTVVGGLSTAARNVISGNQAGVYLENSATDILIEGNFIGTDPRGFKAIGNQYDGVLLSGTLNTVGGTAANAGNLISGNGRNGISDGSYAGSIGLNLIEGNLVGTDSRGAVAILNGQNGIDINTVGDTIGGTAAAARNVISGNAGYGIRISGSGSDNLVEGNDIGTTKTGTTALGNSQDGIHIQDNASDNTIGGTVSGAGNVIEFNGGAGVAVGDNAQFDPILTNSVFSNGDLGINLSGNGNQNLQPPALASAVSTGKKTTIAGSLTGFAANSVYLIQFFSNSVADPSGLGEGQKYVGSLQVTTDGTGAASFQAVFNTSVPVGDSVSATTTDPSNDTSGFAADVTVSRSGHSSIVTGITSQSAPDAVATDTVLGTLSAVVNNQNDAIIADLAFDQIVARPRRIIART